MLVQLLVQNCIILQCFAAHGWKFYWVYFHTQQTTPHFDFPLGSYNSFSGDCSRGKQPREDSWKSISWKPFHILYLFISFSCSYLSRRVVPSINIPMLPRKRRLWMIRIQTPLFSCVLTKPERDLYPLLLCFPSRRLHKWPCHQHPIHAPGPSIPGCVGLILWECGWANPWFRLPYRDGG